MKKLIIIGFFLFMIILTFVVVHATASILMTKTEINYRKLTHTLSETEVDNYNKLKILQKPLIIKEGYNLIRYDEIKETRTRKILGWSTKVDTLVSYVNQEDCGCRGSH